MQISEFIQECIERPGGVVEPVGPGLLEVLLPPPLENLAGGGSWATLALDPDALASDPHAELATFGSSFVDDLIRFATEHGTAVAGHVAVERPRRKGLREEVEHTLVFSNCRLRFSADEPDILNDAYVQFNFRVTFFSDERRERLYSTPVSLRTNRASLLLAERLPVLQMAEIQAPWPDAPRCSVQEAYATARATLGAQIQEETDRRKALIHKRFAVEAARVSDYYTQLAQDLERRAEREADPARTAALSQKVEAARSERERKLRELGETYHLRVRAQLTSARLLTQPKSFFNVQVDRGQATRTLTLVYDSVLERLEPPLCDHCHREATRLHVSHAGEILCVACAEKR